MTKFPLEIREMIFEEAVEWCGTAPNILNAFCCNESLYLEVMKVFRRENTLHLQVGSKTADETSAPALREVQNLYV